MAKFNVTDTRAARGAGPIVAERTPSTVTHEGGPGYVRDAKSELFLLAVSNFVGENTFYESADQRDNRYATLVRQVAVADPDWTRRFLGWLRGDGNMRSASLVGALEAAQAMLDAKLPGARQIVASVLQRADEPGEALAYWTSRYGRAIPKPVKRGVADAVRHAYTEYALLKYDTASKGFRFADVLDLVHPTPSTLSQGCLFRHALNRRHGRDEVADELAALEMVSFNLWLRKAAEGEPEALLNADALKRAGMTWEDALSLVGSKVDKARLWESLIPSMGYMALLRNLRNFDEAGVPDSVAEQVATRLADPAQVAKSRQFPFRFLSAYEAAPSLRWGHALDKALQASLGNLPAFPGRTLVLVDTSGSMTSLGHSARSKVTPLKAAAVFGVALAARGEQVDLVGFADGARPFRQSIARGDSVIREVDKFVRRSGEDGHGTNIAGSLRRTFAGHDRVVLISDMQTMDSGTTSAIPRTTPLYGFNLGGYRPAAFDAGSTNRIEFGGMTDAAFRMIPLIEAGRNADWPF